MRLLVVEDESELAVLLRQVLERAGFAVDSVAGQQAAEDHLAVAEYAAVVLDLGLADGDGMTLLRSLRRQRAAVPVLILTARDAPEDRVAGLDAGADDYLVKPFHMPELVARVRALLRRPSAVLDVALGFADVSLETDSRTVRVCESVLTLSPRETALLEQLLRRGGKVVPRESIEQNLYGFDTPTGPNALEVLVHRLRRRLQDAGARAAIHTIRGVGYLLADGE
jgi:DNA-binding response OmpR family regulator